MDIKLGQSPPKIDIEIRQKNFFENVSQSRRYHLLIMDFLEEREAEGKYSAVK